MGFHQGFTVSDVVLRRRTMTHRGLDAKQQKPGADDIIHWQQFQTCASGPACATY